MSDPRLQQAIAEIGRHYGGRLIGVALFGSRVGGRSRAESDWDVLLALTEDEPIRRRLYREWDDQVAPRIDGLLPGISPHFVHLPADDDRPSSLWLEVASTHQILSDPAGRLGAWLHRVRGLIEARRFERRIAHGLPYWRSVG